MSCLHKCFMVLAGLILATVAQAESKVYQDWSTGAATDGSAVSALTLNLDGDVLAEVCYLDKHCEWRFSTKNFSCVPGVKSTMLMNAKGGANFATTECIGELMEKTWTSKIENWSTFESVVENNPEVAFAIPGGGTSFRVIRFSLRGMKAATAAIGGAINPNGPNASQTRTVRDETL